MSERETIQMAIDKAIGNGWNGVVTQYSFVLQDGALGYWANLFSRDFAKALWGNMFIKTIETADEVVGLPEWQYRLQQMVIADNPIKYLGENL